MKDIGLKNSLDNKLQIYYTCSIEFRSILKVIEKTSQPVLFSALFEADRVVVSWKRTTTNFELDFFANNAKVLLRYYATRSIRFALFNGYQVIVKSIFREF